MVIFIVVVVLLLLHYKRRYSLVWLPAEAQQQRSTTILWGSRRRPSTWLHLLSFSHLKLSLQSNLIFEWLWAHCIRSAVLVCLVPTHRFFGFEIDEAFVPDPLIP